MRRLRAAALDPLVASDIFELLQTLLCQLNSIDVEVVSWSTRERMTLLVELDLKRH